MKQLYNTWLKQYLFKFWLINKVFSLLVSASFICFETFRKRIFVFLLKGLCLHMYANELLWDTNFQIKTNFNG